MVLVEQAAGLRTELEVHERLAKELVQMLEADEALEATAEIVVRRCYFHRGTEPEESDNGYCMTLWLAGYGTTLAEAAKCGTRALELAAGCLLKLQPHGERAQGSELG